MRPRRDWEELVRPKLAGLAIEPREKREVIEELAAHLEESYQALLKEGAPDQAAFHRVLSQVTNWRDLQRKVFIAKRSGHVMQKRLHQLWIPGFLTLILSMLFLATFQKLGFQLRIIGSGTNTIFFCVPWLLSLPFFGALGAYLSSRAGVRGEPCCLRASFPCSRLPRRFSRCLQ